MVWTGINVVVAALVIYVPSCIGEDSTEQPQLIVLMKDRFVLHNFILCLSVLTQKFTQL